MEIMDEDVAVIGIGCNFPGGKNDILQPNLVTHGALFSA